MPVARLDQVSLSFGLRPLFDHADLQIRRGERLCLLGRNGEGKSTLLKLLMREIAADSGEVWVRPGTRLAVLEQEVAADSMHSVRDGGVGERPTSGRVDVFWSAGRVGVAQTSLALPEPPVCDGVVGW